MTIAFIERSYSRAVSRQLLALCCAAAVLGGCGGGGGTVHRRHYASPAAFAAAADGVCRRSATRGTRLARLHGLVPPPPERDLFDHWLKAERSALDAARAIAHPPKKSPEIDPHVELAVAEGKVAGYAGRLGAEACTHAPTVTMPS
jgi:hypothetical protein